MAKTPSKGLDQNGKESFVDRYWGRVPQFLVYMPEAFICEANQDYLELMAGVLDGSITTDSISRELYDEVNNILINLACPCLLTGKEQAILFAFLGGIPCEKPDHKLPCLPGETVCCNLMISCEPETICT